jgi:hypothetical protein
MTLPMFPDAAPVLPDIRPARRIKGTTSQLLAALGGDFPTETVASLTIGFDGVEGITMPGPPVNRADANRGIRAAPKSATNVSFQSWQRTNWRWQQGIWVSNGSNPAGSGPIW